MTELWAALLTGAVVTVFGVGAVLVVRAVGDSQDADDRTPPQLVPYHGGSSPTLHAWNRYHVRYYPMTLLFVAFEMEMMFMYPWAVVYVQTGTKALVEMGMFLSILSLGVVYAWREGALRWQ